MLHGQRANKIETVVVCCLQLFLQFLLQLPLDIRVEVVEDIAVPVGRTALLNEPLKGHRVEQAVHELVLDQAVVGQEGGLVEADHRRGVDANDEEAVAVAGEELREQADEDGPDELVQPDGLDLGAAHLVDGRCLEREAGGVGELVVGGWCGSRCCGCGIELWRGGGVESVGDETGRVDVLRLEKDRIRFCDSFNQSLQSLRYSLSLNF